MFLINACMYMYMYVPIYSSFKIQESSLCNNICISYNIDQHKTGSDIFFDSQMDEPWPLKKWPLYYQFIESDSCIYKLPV